MTGLSRLGIKLFLRDAASVRVNSFVPIFHSWIQKQCVPDHQLIDVHDYSHIHNGPGILLVSHEANFTTDLADGRLGLAYYRKLPTGNTLEETLRSSLQSLRGAASLLEAEPALEKHMSFRKDELLVVSNDRLLAPNDDTTFEALRPVLAKVFGDHATLTHSSKGSKDRLTIRVANQHPLV